jgi:transposase
MTITMLGIDLGKTLCSVVGLDAGGLVILRRRLRRSSLVGPVIDSAAIL